MRKFTWFIGIFVFFATSLAPASAEGDAFSADWLMPNSPGSGYTGAIFMEPTIYPGSTSYLMSNTYNGLSHKTSEIVCKSLKTESCSTSNNFSYQAYIPVCQNDSETNCIDKFWIVLHGKKYFPVLDTYMPVNSPVNFKGDTVSNLPEGKSPSIWRIYDTEVATSVQLYSVSAIMTGSAFGATPIFGNPDISVVIDPVLKVSGSYSIPRPSETGNGWSISGCLHANCGGSDGIVGFCSAVDINSCAKRINNIEGIRYGVSLRITDPPSTWIHGRLSQPTFQIETANNKTVWSVEAEPIALPVISGWLATSKAIENNFYGQPPTDLQAVTWTGPYSSGTDALTQFNKWIPYMGDTALAMQKRWSFRTIKNSQVFNGKTVKECLDSNQVAGLVISNATVYQGEPPTWNAVDSTLDYKVAAPHFTPSGATFEGLYQLKINSTFAKCIYGFQDVPFVATVSIVGSDGSTKVATSTISQDSTWINFQASGFTFSNPTIKVKLERAASPANPSQEGFNQGTPNAQGSEVKVKPAQAYIYCVKGKTIRKISGSKPKCPTGFKIRK